MSLSTTAFFTCSSLSVPKCVRVHTFFVCVRVRKCERRRMCLMRRPLQTNDFESKGEKKKDKKEERKKGKDKKKKKIKVETDEKKTMVECDEKSSSLSLNSIS